MTGTFLKLALGALLLAPAAFCADTALVGRVLDAQGKTVAGATVRLQGGASNTVVSSGEQGQFRIAPVAAGAYRLTAEAPGFQPHTEDVTIPVAGTLNVTLSGLAAQHQSVVIGGGDVEPGVDLRNAEVFDRTLFTRDDQVMQQLNAGIDAGQHEGGGKSLEIRRFGFNLDHGGVNGGLKVLVDDVQQNQATQGHGQGYLGSLKSLTPELVEGVDIINGPFDAAYGDFSGLGVVHIRTRESMPDVWTLRLQGGSFGSERGFFSFSPELRRGDALFAYEGSHTDGPFQSPLRYTRHNLTGSFTERLNQRRSVGFKYNAGWNDFYSSGQI